MVQVNARVQLGIYRNGDMRTRVFTLKVLKDNKEEISITTISQFEALNLLKPVDHPNCFSSNCLVPRAKKSLLTETYHCNFFNNKKITLRLSVVSRVLGQGKKDQTLEKKLSRHQKRQQILHSSNFLVSIPQDYQIGKHFSFILQINQHFCKLL